MAHEPIHDENERRKWQNPEAILITIGLSCCFTFIDIGCGDGFFALPAAEIVGETGKVYALDQNFQAIDNLRVKAVSAGLRNVEARAEAEETVLCEACADVVFFGIVLHDFNDPRRVLTNARRILKATGRLIDLDWKKEPMELGPQ